MDKVVIFIKKFNKLALLFVKTNCENNLFLKTKLNLLIELV